MKQISITVSEAAHWHALIGRAEYLVQQFLPISIADYLVALFLRLEHDNPFICQSALQPLSENETNMDGRLQYMGDKCLLLCGFYPDISQEYDIDLQEFVHMGRQAYRSLATVKNGEDAVTFDYLASNFEAIIEMLSRIHQLSNSNIKATADVRYTATNSNGPALHTFTEEAMSLRSLH